MALEPNTNRNAWVQLYEARNVPSEPEVRLPGRPPGMIPRRKVGMTLSQGEISEIEHWQDRFSKLMGRKVSAGETIGILTRVASGRVARFGGDADKLTLAELVERLVGED